ncbi:MAG: hypothetical protein KAJ19_28995, partial [Gammaproteobacteria bacterium]|nr:hypothetical protein [Gammaproteobacteria bacterium]
MKCRECKMLIDKMLEGTIESSETDALDRHIQNCRQCRTEYEAIGAMESILGASLSADTHAGKASQTVLARIDSLDGRARENQTAGPKFVLRRWGSIAACFALAAGIGLGLLLSRAGVVRQNRALANLVVPIQVSGIEGTVLVKHSVSDSWQ